MKVIEPFQMLGEVKDDLKDIIGIDTALLESKKTSLGFDKNNWKEWQLYDGTPVLVRGLFNIEKEQDGSIFQYPEGDRAASPSVCMPKNGFYFDAIVRQNNFEDDKLDPKII